MKILMVSSECVPFAKTGGLADVCGALPLDLKKLGHEVRVIMPKYKKIDSKKFRLKKRIKAIRIPMDRPGSPEEASVLEGELAKGIPVFFIDNKFYYERDELYRTSEGDYPDNDRRFVFFSRAALEVAKAVDFQPDIIHCHDWQSALIPVYLKISLTDFGRIISIHLKPSSFCSAGEGLSGGSRFPFGALRSVILLIWLFSIRKVISELSALLKPISSPLSSG